MTPMFNMVMLLNALQQSDQQGDVKAPRLGKILAGVVGFLAGTLILAVYLAIGAYNLWKAWQTGDWFNFWTPMPIFIIIFVPFAVLIPLSRLWTPFAKQREILRSSSHTIRDALALNDERLMPPVPLQPAPLAPADLAAGTVRLGPLRQFAVGNPTRGVAALFFLPFAFLFVFFQLLFLNTGDDLGPFNFNFLDTTFFPLFPVALFALFAVFMGIGITMARLRIRGKGLYVTVDAQGVQWQRPAPHKGEVRIAWDQVRSLSRVVYNGAYSTTGAYGYGANAYSTSGWGPSMAYVLEAPDAVLVWTLGALSKPEEAAATEALLRTAVTRTGKPLRDLTGFATEIAQSGGNVGYILANRLPGTAPTAAFAPLMSGPQAKRRPRIWPWLVAAVVVLLIGSLYGGGAWVQSYQPTYFAHLPALIHAEKPLVHDDLASPDGVWITKAPNKDELDGYAYVNGSYQLSGNQSGYTIEEIDPYQEFGDAVAYEITATQSGTLQKDSGDGVGIVFNSNVAQDNFMTFDVTSTGDWEIYHFKYVDDRASDNWNYITGGHSDAIHAGEGMTNQLLLVVRGHYFLVYINGQFVESYDARYDAADLPTSGYAGPYLGESSLVGTFNNFSVYPVKPVTFPDWQYV